MSFDTKRLYQALLNTGLQNKDNPLYQVIYQLIGALTAAQTTINTLVSSSSSTTNNTSQINNIYQIFGSDDGGGDADIIPGSKGDTGLTGATGATGPEGVMAYYGLDGEDGETYPSQQGPQGNPGTTGSTGGTGASIPYDEIIEEFNIMQLVSSSGGSSTPSGLVFLGSQVASASATLDFTSLISSTYNVYIFEFENILPATDNVDFLMRTSTDNGSSYDAGASDYQFANFVNNTGSFSTDDVCSAGATAIKIAPTIDSGSTTGGINGYAKLYNPLNASQYKSVEYHVNGFLNDNQFYNQIGSGWRVATADIDAVRFLMSSGNIASGTIRMYGVKNS